MFVGQKLAEIFNYIYKKTKKFPKGHLGAWRVKRWVLHPAVRKIAFAHDDDDGCLDVEDMPKQVKNVSQPIGYAVEERSVWDVERPLNMTSASNIQSWDFRIDTEDLWLCAQLC